MLMACARTRSQPMDGVAIGEFFRSVGIFAECFRLAHGRARGMRRAIQRDMMAFTYRLMGAAMLDGGTYEQIESDRRANWQAVAVVVMASVAAGFGAHMEVWGGLGGFVRVSAISLVAWIAWAVLALQIGSRVLPQRQTRSDTGEMMRTLGFATAPGILQVFGMIPGVQAPVLAITSLWMFAAMVVALKHALDYTSLGRALAVCAIAAVIVLVFAFGIGALLSRTVSAIP